MSLSDIILYFTHIFESYTIINLNVKSDSTRPEI